MPTHTRTLLRLWNVQELLPFQGPKQDGREVPAPRPQTLRTGCLQGVLPQRLP